MEGQLSRLKEHRYETALRWIGNLGMGTRDYGAYSRDYEVSGAGKVIAVPGSSDPLFRGDGTRYNPEELLVASLSTCHMLWYLHLCAVNGINVTAYEDRASGSMTEAEDGSGQFSLVVLRPRVTIGAESDAEKALQLHEEAHAMCFIANSVRFPVRHEALILRL
jgi:organic hydroperoxide reductase OsmC/OhrA